MGATGRGLDPGEGVVMTEPTERPPSWQQLAAELARMNGGIVGRLLGDHTVRPDGMCASCSDGGTGRHRTVWPCSIRKLAQMAEQMRAGGVP